MTGPRHAALAAILCATGVGMAGTAAADTGPVALPLSTITTPVSQAPRFLNGNPTSFDVEGARRGALLSCQPSPNRAAWSVPVNVDSIPGSGSGVVPPIAVQPGAPVVNGVAPVGYQVELVLYGAGDALLTRSGCFGDSPVQGFALATWGSISESLSPAQIGPTGNGQMPVGAELAVLPGQAASASPGRAAPPIPTFAVPATTVPGNAASAGAVPVAPASRHPAGRSHRWQVVVLLLVSGVLLLMSRAHRTWHRVGNGLAGTGPGWRAAGARNVGSEKAGIIGSTAGELCLPLMLAAVALSAGLGAWVLALGGGLVCGGNAAGLIAARRGHDHGPADLVRAATARPVRTAIIAAIAGAATWLVVGHSVPGAVYVAMVAAAIATAYAAATSAAVTAGHRASWVPQLAAVLGVSEQQVADIRWEVAGDDVVTVGRLPASALAKLDGIRDRCAAVMPGHEVQMATAAGVILVPVTPEEADRRARVAASSGLVTRVVGADRPAATAPYSGWTGVSEPPPPPAHVVDPSEL